MSKFKKKPVIIEAFQYFNDMGTYTSVIPVWFNEAIIDGVVFCITGSTFIKTLEGTMLVSDGDYVIKGIKGEIYPCKPDIFEQSYEVVK